MTSRVVQAFVGSIRAPRKVAEATFPSPSAVDDSLEEPTCQV